MSRFFAFSAQLVLLSYWQSIITVHMLFIGGELRCQTNFYAMNVANSECRLREQNVSRQQSNTNQQ